MESISSKSSGHTQHLITEKKLSLLLGGFAIALPTILYLGNWYVFGDVELRSSMSSYYYTNMRDVFVGILFAMGVFLLAYEGYDLIDRIATTICGFLSFGVALFPTPAVETEMDTIGMIHLLSAVTFYFILSLFLIFRFTKSYNEEDKPKSFGKKVRNGIYYVCGVLMLISIFLLVGSGLEFFSIPVVNYVFWLEYIANASFGTAWLVKGEGIFFLNDDPILDMNPWELFGLGIVMLLFVANFVMLSSIAIIAY